MLPWAADLVGRIERHTIDSALLRGNPLDDPHVRPLWVYVPPGYDDESGRRYPSIYVIQGYSGHLGTWSNRTPFRQPFPELADAVFATGDVPPAVETQLTAKTDVGDAAQSGAEGSQRLDVGLGEGGGPVSG